MTDSAFLFHVLEDGKWHGQAEILARSMTERGHGMTVHSRAADLRNRGCVVECELRRNGHGRSLSYYRLVTLGEASSVSDHGLEADVSDSAADGASPSVPATLPAAEPSEAGTLFDIPAHRGAYGDAA